MKLDMVPYVFPVPKSDIKTFFPSVDAATLNSILLNMLSKVSSLMALETLITANGFFSVYRLELSLKSSTNF
jgi:hypothetical protein